jgi:hypothetical protein
MMWHWFIAALLGLAALTTAKPLADGSDRRGRFRRAVIAAARSQLGQTDSAPYWRDVLSPNGPWPPAWCGAFALWAIHQAGLGLGIKWDVGSGFCHHLKPTRMPQPGDVAYFDKLQHHALVAEVDYQRGTMTTIDGNSDGGAVVEHQHVPLSKAAGFFSIDPWIDAETASG